MVRSNVQSALSRQFAPRIQAPLHRAVRVSSLRRGLARQSAVDMSARINTTKGALTVASPQIRAGSLCDRYLQCLADNEHVKCRVPDAAPRKTFVFNSVSSLQIPIIMNTAGSEGRFAAAFMPQMGDDSQPTNYQAAIANVPTEQWNDTDWSAAASYLAEINGRDPRIDINSGFLTAATPVTFNQTASVTNPALSQNTAGVANFLSPTAATQADVNSTGNWIFSSRDNTVVVPAGTWILATTAGFTAATAGTYQLNSNSEGVTAFNTLNTSPLVDVINVRRTTSTVAAAGSGTLTLIEELSSPSSFSYTPMITVGGAPAGAASLTTINSQTTITPASAEGFSIPSNNGVIQLIRPVAQTVLFTYMGPSLTDGGRISANYVTKETMVDNFFTQNAGNQGNYQNVENLACSDGAWDGPLKDGAYVWWSPFDPSDWEFQTISSMNANQWPGLVVSGTFTPTGTAAVTGTVTAAVRCRLITTFEATTTSTAFDTQVVSGSQNEMDCAFKALGQQPHAMPNGKHKSWISSVLGAASKYGPSLAKTAMTLAPLLL